jgi:peptide/nickel transport system substrate-binding protein
MKFSLSSLPIAHRSWQPLYCAALVATGVLLTNCSRSSVSVNPGTVNGTPTQSGILVYGASGQPISLDAGNATDGNSIVVHNQIYNRLIEFKPGTAELEPGLATAWQASPDGKTWTFTLRPGVKFHDGTDFNAEAVRFNLERWWNPQDPSRGNRPFEAWKQTFGGFKGDPNSLLEEIQVKDTLTIQLRLKQPFAVFPSAIAAGFFGIASPTAIRAHKNYGTPAGGAVGTGAFALKEWRTGDRIVLQKNSAYWKAGLPKVTQLVIRFIADPAARLAQVRAGQVDFTVDLAPDQKTEIERDANLQAIGRPSFNVGYLALNPRDKPLSDVRVRQAIAHALNRPAIVKAFWGDLGVHDAHLVPPVLAWSTAPQIKPYEFNPQKAKQLLTEAGFPQGFDLQLWYMPVSRPYFPTPKPIAEAFAADLSAVGIRVKLQTKDWAAYIADRNTPPGFQSFMLGWSGDYGDPDTFYYPHYGPGSTADLGGWKDDRLLRLLAQGRATADQAARAKIYGEVDTILHQQALRLPIVHSEPLLVQRKTIQGWNPSPLGTEPFEAIAKP